MRAFVAGATGWTGRHVVQALCEAGVETHAHIRPDSLRLGEWESRFLALGASPDTTEWASEPMTERLSSLQPDLVFSLLGTTRKRAQAGGGTYREVDEALTLLLAEACPSVSTLRFVYLSSLGVGPRARGAYLQTRWRVERALEHRLFRRLIIRPSLIIGERDDRRPGERWAARVLRWVLAPLRWVGAHALADRHAPMEGEALARGIVAHALVMKGEFAILDSDDMRNPPPKSLAP